MIRVGGVASVALILGTAGCFLIPEAPPPEPVTNKGVGEVCSTVTECREGLTCSTATKTCAPVSEKKKGETCSLTANCLSGLFCSSTGVCAESGTTAVGGSCSDNAACMAGLVCSIGSDNKGMCAMAGTADVGAACTKLTDCLAGLLCFAGTCMSASGAQPWSGASCIVEQEATPKVLFKVPRAADPASDDFYRLPFPNDIRKKNGKVSLAGHPRPGVGLLGFDPVDRYIKAIEEEATGFGLNPLIVFRFARNPETDSNKAGSLHAGGAVGYLNITPGSPEYGLQLGTEWSATTDGTRYICPRYLVLRGPVGYPLRPGTTYAALIGRVVRDDAGQQMQQDDDFKAMLAASAPADADLAAAWTAYKPLRDWIADKKINADDIAAAAVFTTDKVEDPLAKLYAATRAAKAPEVKGFMHCGEAGKTSPCEDGKSGADHERGCLPAPAGARYDEYQGTISVPIFQKGTPPYEQPADGGGIVFDANGVPPVQRTEDVCFSLTVPKGTAPGAGWPVLVYGHGTDGSYQTGVASGLPNDFAAGDSFGGAAAPAAMLSYDGILHGPRKGNSTKKSGDLVYNLLNPPAARDNALQAAVDMFAMARAVQEWSAGGIKLDKAKMALYGHSQGANAAALAIGREPGYGAVVLSGSGGTLYLSFLTRKNPTNIAAFLPGLLSDSPVDANHPVLALVQMYFDRSDPVNYARRIFAEPVMPALPRHFLHIYGTSDSYSPVETQQTMAKASSLPVALPMVDNYGLPMGAGPLKENVTVGQTKVTAAEAQYNPDGYDGHFVSTSNPTARKTLRQMVGTFFRDGAPTLP